MRYPLMATSLSLSAALVLVPARAQEPANDPQNPRGELEALAVELDAAVRRVSQAGIEPILGSEPARGYYVPGLGAMFVVPPRSIPREERLLALRPHPRGATPSTSAATNDPEYPELEQLLGPEAAREIVARRQLDEQTRRELARNARRQRASSPQRDLDMRRVEEQVEAFQREVERLRQDTEQAWDEITLEVQKRHGGGSGGATSTPSRGGGTPSTSVIPTLAPWRYWFGADDPEDPRSQAQIMADVKTAIVGVLEAHGGVLRNVGPQEQVSVAVDFLPRGLFVGMQRPARTLIVRVKKHLLEERQAGRLSTEQLRAQLEVSEY